MHISNVEKVKGIKAVEGGARRGNKFRAEVKEFNSSKKEAILVLKNGKEIRAKFEGDSNRFHSEMSYNFEVVSYENGEFKLKVMGDFQNKSTDLSSVEIFMKESKISPKFKVLLELMTKHNIPLTKDNINKFNSFIELNGKSLEDLDNSINNLSKYIKERLENTTGRKADISEIKVGLKEAFSQFLKLSKDDIAMFFENKIDFNMENFQSFNKIFKKPQGFYNILKGLEEFINLEGSTEEFTYEYRDNSIVCKDLEKVFSFNEKEENNLFKKTFANEHSFSEKNNLVNKHREHINEEENIKYKSGSKNDLGDTLKGSEETEIFKLVNKKIDKLFSLLEGMSIEGENLSKEALKNLVEPKNGSFRESIIKWVGEIFSNSGEGLNGINKFNLSRSLNQLLHKEVTLSETSFREIKTVLEGIKDNLKENKVFFQHVRENKGLFNHSGSIVSEIKNKEEEMQGIIKKLIRDISTNSNKTEIISNILKNNINDFKLFNSIGHEYYYLDLPININKEEYGCKLIVKDNRGEGKNIDKDKAKLILTVDTVNLGSVDALLSFSGKKLNLEIKSIGESVDYLRRNLSKLEKSLELLGFMSYIFVSEKVYNTSNISTYREFFNNASKGILNELI